MEVSLTQAVYFDIPQIGVKTDFSKQNYQLLSYFRKNHAKNTGFPAESSTSIIF